MMVPLIGIAGVIVGGATQYVATTMNQRWKYKIETRTAAYQALLDALSRMSIFNGHIARKDEAELSLEELKMRLDLNMELQSARNRLALYASQSVLRKLATFTSKHALLLIDIDYEAYIDFIEAMREDSFVDTYVGFRHDADNLFLRGALTKNNSRPSDQKN